MAETVFWITALLDPNSSEFYSCVAIFSILYLGHGIGRRKPFFLVASETNVLVRYRGPQVSALRVSRTWPVRRCTVTLGRGGLVFVAFCPISVHSSATPGSGRARCLRVSIALKRGDTSEV